MLKYELMLILDTALEDAVREEAIEAVKGVIATDGEVTNVDLWGNKKLAYPIEKKNEGYYVVIEFNSSPELPKELDRRLKISENIMRHMIIKKDEK